jgi:hypothetical protein
MRRISERFRPRRSQSLGSRCLVSRSLLFVTFLTAGCHGRIDSARDIPSRPLLTTPTISSLTSSPLSVRVAEPALLAQVSSVLIAPPSVAAARAPQALSTERLSTLVEGIATRELSATSVGSRWLTASPANQSAVSEFSRAGASSALARLGIDTVIKMEVTHFEERIGTRVGGEPATVAFTMTALRSIDGRQIWQAQFSHSQHAVSDNLFRLGDKIGDNGRSLGWSSGDQILEAGIVSALRDLSLRREQQFVKTPPVPSR